MSVGRRAQDFLNFFSFVFGGVFACHLVRHQTRKDTARHAPTMPKSAFFNLAAIDEKSEGAHTMHTHTDEDKITLKDAAKMLNCSRRTIQNAIARGKITPVRCGISRRAYYVTRASVEAIMKGGAQ